MKNSKKEKDVDVLEKDDKINGILINPKFFAVGIIIGFIIIIGCLILNFGIGCSMLLILLELNLFMGLLVENDAKTVYRLYRVFKEAYEDDEMYTLEVHGRYGINKFYTNFKKNFNILKVITLFTIIVLIVGYIALSIACSNPSINHKLIGEIQNITTVAVAVLCGIVFCYSNACYKKDFMQRYQFMCNNYRDLCEARKNRTSLYR